MDETLSHLSIIRTWAACGALDPGDNEKITQWLDQAIADIREQERTIESLEESLDRIMMMR